MKGFFSSLLLDFCIKMMNQENQNVQSTETSRAEIVTNKRIDSTDKLKVKYTL